MDWITAIDRDSVSASLPLYRICRIFTAAVMVLALAAEGATAFASSALNRVSCGTSAFQSAGTDACSVYLTASPNRKFHVYLSSNNPSLTVPSAVTVRAGNLSTGFNAVVTGVTTAQTAMITAQANGIIETFKIALSPPISGTPAVSVSTNSLSFGTVSVGTAVSQSVTITSTGTATLVINSATILGSGFSVLGGNNFPTVLSPGQAAVISLQFDPTSAGSVTGQLTISSNASTASVSLSGTGTAIAPTVSGLTCSNSSFTGSGTDPCTLTLSSTAPTGGQTVALSSNNNAVITPSSVTVPPGSSSAPFTATLTWVTTAQTATLTASANSSSKAFAVQLNAATAAMAVNASSIGFGSAYLNTPVEQAVILSSAGTAPLTVSSVTISGTGFSESGSSFPITLNPGQSVTIDVQFDPTTIGNFNGQLTIASSASTGTVALTGTGQAHTVSLTWSAPSGSSDPVTGYYIYRAVVGTTSYQRLNASVQSQTAYIDSTVQSGSSYDYEVTSVDANGVESSPSNLAAATIP